MPLTRKIYTALACGASTPGPGVLQKRGVCEVEGVEFYLLQIRQTAKEV